MLRPAQVYPGSCVIDGPDTPSPERHSLQSYLITAR